MSLLSNAEAKAPARRSTTVALAHHWMEQFRGGEAVLEEFCTLFPRASINVLVFGDKGLSPRMRKHRINTSFLQRSAPLRKNFRKLLPLFPEVIRSMRVPSDANFVLSSDASLIKGIPLRKGVPHVCYCHSPPRYLWGLEDAYLESASHNRWWERRLFSAVIPRLRGFDRRMAERVDHFIANSACVQERILRCYGRESVVIHPPVNVERFRPGRPRQDFYLCVSALVPYKRVDLAVEACTKMGRRLVIIGTGPEEAHLRAIAGPTVEFLGWQSTAVVQDHFERCRAFIFPGIEDFGITPCEAQAAGAPVLAFGEGGALETVRDGVSGLFFRKQTSECVGDCLQEFERRHGFEPEVCRANVAGFGPERFRREIRDFLERVYPQPFQGYTWPEELSMSTPR